MTTAPVPEKKASAREKIAQLRAEFVRVLPERVVHLQALLERMKSDPADTKAASDLHRYFHNVKGTGRSFGFRDLGAIAGEGEKLASDFIDSPGGKNLGDWQLRLQTCIEGIATTADAIFIEGEEMPETGLPLFNLPEFLSEEKGGCGGRAVYICDDEELTLQQVASQLACFGYQCQCFTTPQALHDAVLAHWPDAVIMDIHFPQGPNAGTDMLIALRKETNKTVPAVFLSARNDFEARLTAVQAGGQAFLTKPAEVMELVSALDNLTGQRQPGAYRILLVDDEPEINRYHSIILEEAGMLTHSLSDPNSILETLDAFRPDLVLLDIYLPECNGRDLAQVIRQLPDYMSVPIIFLSSETDHKKQFSAMRVGAEGFLTKPVNSDELIEAVSIRAERMRVLRSMMARDSLTGLFNHSATTRFIESAIGSARRHGGAICFAMIDIDFFKKVNDTHGHPAGDQVLLALARMMQQRLRTTDIVGRYGGEEFAVILHDVALPRAAELIDELRQAFSQIQFHSSTGDFSCTFSAGISCLPDHDRMEFLREAADKALYFAKHQGRNRVVTDTTQTRSENPI